MGLALSYAFVFLAALPIRYMRLTFGRKTFTTVSVLSAGVLFATGLWQWALVYSSISLLIGLYIELEDRHFSIFQSSSVSVLATLGLIGASLVSYSQLSAVSLQRLLADRVTPLMEQLQQVPRFKEASVDSILWFLPSGIIVTMMVVLFVSLTLNRTPTTKKQQFEMRMFRLPDWFIWVFLAALGGTFIKTSVPAVSMVGLNLLTVVLAAYFFQGLAVFTYFLDRLAIFGFWRLLAYFIVFFQMFLFISGLGILDYWFDFRPQGLTNSNNKKIKKIKRSTK